MMSKAMTWRRSDANRKCRKKPMGKQNMSCRCEFSICRTMGEWQKKRRQRIEERRTLKIWLIQKIKGNDERIIDVYIEIPWAAAIASCRRRGPRFWTMLIPKVFACCIVVVALISDCIPSTETCPLQEDDTPSWASTGLVQLLVRMEVSNFMHWRLNFLAMAGE